ncbi:proline-rich protein DC2.15 [Sesamum alatum]|uniref:Proline-rich protein DC2.15 n=1 Tax=Sesamum alatum TaxID=300844 RepID=A0AAE1Y888_9LAMI|nr:proline-rich protein DC2.15 [Sesamum alatum]
MVSSVDTLVVQPPTSATTFPKDTLKLRVCADLLHSLIGILPIGKPPKEQCCGLIQGLINLDAAVCLWTTIKAGLLGRILIDVDLAIEILLSACGKNVASIFTITFPPSPSISHSSPSSPPPPSDSSNSPSPPPPSQDDSSSSPPFPPNSSDNSSNSPPPPLDESSSNPPPSEDNNNDDDDGNNNKSPPPD